MGFHLSGAESIGAFHRLRTDLVKCDGKGEAAKSGLCSASLTLHWDIFHIFQRDLTKVKADMMFTVADQKNNTLNLKHQCMHQKMISSYVM